MGEEAEQVLVVDELGHAVVAADVQLAQVLVTAASTQVHKQLLLRQAIVSCVTIEQLTFGKSYNFSSTLSISISVEDRFSSASLFGSLRNLNSS